MQIDRQITVGADVHAKLCKMLTGLTLSSSTDVADYSLSELADRVRGGVGVLRAHDPISEVITYCLHDPEFNTVAYGVSTSFGTVFVLAITKSSGVPTYRAGIRYTGDDKGIIQTCKHFAAYGIDVTQPLLSTINDTYDALCRTIAEVQTIGRNVDDPNAQIVFAMKTI